MNQKIERRIRMEKVQLRASTDGKGKGQVITGYASVFAPAKSEDLGGFIEQVDPHAFDDTLTGDVPGLFNHNPDFILGRTKAGTMRLSTDKTGLRYEIDVPDTQVGRDLVTSIQRGDVDGSSFSFICEVDDWQDNANGPALRTLKKVRLLDASPVVYPAYPDATSGVRALPLSMPTEIRSRITKAEQRSEEKTKTVDGEDLTADCFLIVGDPDKTDTWHLPWKFSTDAKTESHLRNALARFDQVKGVSADDKDAAWKKLVSLCTKYGIYVSDDDKEEKSLRGKKAQTNTKRDAEDGDPDVPNDDEDIIPDDPQDDADGDNDETCECDCAQCRSGACSICSNDDCDDETCSCYNQDERSMQMTLKLKRLSVPTR